jgi:hypothetical protein
MQARWQADGTVLVEFLSTEGKIMASFHAVAPPANQLAKGLARRRTAPPATKVEEMQIPPPEGNGTAQILRSRPKKDGGGWLEIITAEGKVMRVDPASRIEPPVASPAVKAAAPAPAADLSYEIELAQITVEEKVAELQVIKEELVSDTPPSARARLKQTLAELALRRAELDLARLKKQAAAPSAPAGGRQ